MHAIDWYGNDGRAFLDPGTAEIVVCGVCGTEMRVERNKFAAASFAEAAAGRKRYSDHFTCPRIEEDWHKKVVFLKIKILFGGMRSAEKRAARREVAEILAANR